MRYMEEVFKYTQEKRGEREGRKPCEQTKKEEDWELEGAAAGEKNVSAVGHGELQLVLNVLQQSQSRENNICCFRNLIFVPRQTPV